MSGEGKDGTAQHIIVIDSSKAGKTSLIQCITNAGDKPMTIDVDARTVGIEIVEWEPISFDVDGQHVEPDGLKCKFLDLTGQTEYASSNQFVLVPRALYIIVWRVRPLMRKSDADDMATALCPTFLEQECMIVDFMALLQARVPGATVLLVATHIDCVEGGGISHKHASKEVTEQCNYAKQIVQRKLSEMRLDAEKAGVEALEVTDGSQSMKLNCLKGIMGSFTEFCKIVSYLEGCRK